MKIKKFVHLDENGNPWGAVAAEQLWADVYAIKYNRPERKLKTEDWFTLLNQAIAAALEFGAKSIETRVRLDYESETFKRLFKRLGFSKKSGRIEYQSKVRDLPAEMDSPISWKSAQSLNLTPPQIALFTKQIIQHTLDVDPNENPENFIQDWLKHQEYTSGLNCIDIGFIDNQPCALAVVQINKMTGWSRISYMGLVPNFRNQGLGQHVHRHGFTMIKNQGGTLYHGGTHSENKSMLKLFEKHGCQIYCEMEEWHFQKTEGQS